MSATYPTQREHFLKGLCADSQIQHLPSLAERGDAHMSPLLVLKADSL